MMASPLPKTKAPAKTKKVKMAHRVPLQLLPEALVDAVCNNADHAGALAVEHSLHPGRASVERIEPAEGHHHQDDGQMKANPTRVALRMR
jgi:hypothetical protein